MVSCKAANPVPVFSLLVFTCLHQRYISFSPALGQISSNLGIRGKKGRKSYEGELNSGMNQYTFHQFVLIQGVSCCVNGI